MLLPPGLWDLGQQCADPDRAAGAVGPVRVLQGTLLHSFLKLTLFAELPLGTCWPHSHLVPAHR